MATSEKKARTPIFPFHVIKRGEATVWVATQGQVGGNLKQTVLLKAIDGGHTRTVDIDKFLDEYVAVTVDDMGRWVEDTR